MSTTKDLALIAAQKVYEAAVRTATREGATPDAIAAFLSTQSGVTDPVTLIHRSLRRTSPYLNELQLKAYGGLDAFRALFNLPAAPLVPAAGFEMDGKDIDARSQENIRHALTKLGYSACFDAMKDYAIVMHDKTSTVLDDPTVNRLWLEVDSTYGFRPSIEFFRTVVDDWARQNVFHPVLGYFDKLPTWDGTPRLDTWLSSYAGVEDSEYVRAIAALPLIAAVRRVRHYNDPNGVKFDELLVLVDATQGGGKSQVIEQLCPNSAWFTDSLSLGDDPKVTIENTRGVWIAEIPELQGSAREVEHVKAFLSRKVDGPARMAFARQPVTVPRAFMCFGSTNDKWFLKDPSGNRRFWPVCTGVINVVALARDRDQLWAEASMREARGDSIRLDPKYWALAAAAQDAHFDEDEWTDALEAYRDAEVVPTSFPWIAVGLGDTAKRDQRPARRITGVMTRFGFTDKKLVRVKMPDGTVIVMKCWVRDTNQGIVKFTALPANPHNPISDGIVPQGDVRFAVETRRRLSDILASNALPSNDV